MTYSRISFINPYVAGNKLRCVDADSTFPLNLLSLASYLFNNGFTGDVQILDHQVLREAEFLEELIHFQPNLVVFSPNIDSYQQTLRLAQMLKTVYRADIVLTGNYAGEVADNILKNRNYIDFIIKGNRDAALYELLSGVPLKHISNLSFKKERSFIHNKSSLHSNTSLVNLDYSLINHDKYFNHYRKSLGEANNIKPTVLMSQRGCVWRERSGGCIFCSEANSFARYEHPEKVWEKLQQIRNRFGINSILEISNDFLGSLDWFHHFYKTRPDNMKDFIFSSLKSRTNHITPEIADILQQLNTQEVYLGVESGDKHILKNALKGNSPRQQLQAISLLEERGIGVTTAMQAGLPGESEQSLQNSYSHVKKILSKSNINNLHISVMTPLPGSKSFQMLLNKHTSLRVKYENLDLFPVQEIQKDWVENFCKVEYKVVVEFVELINQQKNKSYIEMY